MKTTLPTTAQLWTYLLHGVPAATSPPTSCYDSAIVICPSCRQEIPVLAVKGLPKNFALLDVLFTFPHTKESSATAASCSACESGHAAAFWCVDCKENFCQEASTWHTRTKLTAKHRVVSLEELKAHPELLLRGAASSSFICAEHDEAFRFYDEQCGQVICRDCVALSHNGHKCCSLAVAAAKCREDIGAVLSQAVTRAKQVEEAERVADQVKHNLNQNYEWGLARSVLRFNWFIFNSFSLVCLFVFFCLCYFVFCFVFKFLLTHPKNRFATRSPPERVCC